MTHSAKTFRLDDDWNIMTEGGELALLVGESATAQNVANEIKLFRNDAWIARDEGNAWFNFQLAKPVRKSATVEALRKSALKVPQVEKVESIELETLDFETRTLKATVVIKTGGKSFALRV